jgi:hypothetical protein
LILVLQRAFHAQLVQPLRVLLVLKAVMDVLLGHIITRQPSFVTIVRLVNTRIVKAKTFARNVLLAHLVRQPSPQPAIVVLLDSTIQWLALAVVESALVVHSLLPVARARVLFAPRENTLLLAQ